VESEDLAKFYKIASEETRFEEALMDRTKELKIPLRSILYILRRADAKDFVPTTRLGLYGLARLRPQKSEEGLHVDIAKCLLHKISSEIRRKGGEDRREAPALVAAALRTFATPGDLSLRSYSLKNGVEPKILEFFWLETLLAICTQIFR